MCIKNIIKKSYLFLKDNYSYITSIYLLLCRAYVFLIFFKSGWLKLKSALKGHWHVVEYLFQHEYNMPFIHYKITAIIGTFSELFFPLLLLLGLVSRASAIVMISIILFINFSYMYHDKYFICGILVLNILIFGPGKFSIDHIISKKAKSKYSN